MTVQEERDFLVTSLEDLERERAAGDLDQADYIDLKDRYTARLADVLRAPPDPISPADTRFRRVDAVRGGSTLLKRLGLSAAVAGLAVLAGVFVARSSGERLPDAPASGSIAATGPSADLRQAQRLIGQGKTLEAIKLYDRIIADDPRQPEALAYRGWLIRLVGREAGRPDLIERGLEFLDRAVAADPTYPDAHFFRGMVLYEDGNDPAGAVIEFRAFLANRPPPAMVPVVEDALRRALADAERAPQAKAQGQS